MSGIFNRTKTTRPLALVCDTNAYASGDVIGGLLKLPVSSVGGGGVIRRAMLVDDDNDGSIITLYFFDAEPSTIADNVAYAPTVADLKKQIGSVAIVAADYSTQNSNKIAIKDGDDLNIDYQITGEYIYIYMVAGESITKTATTDLDLRVTVWQD